MLRKSDAFDFARPEFTNLRQARAARAIGSSVACIADMVVARATSSEDQKKIAAQIQARAFEQTTYIPLGQYVATSIRRRRCSGTWIKPTDAKPNGCRE